MSTLAVGPFELAAVARGGASGEVVAVADSFVAVGATVDVAGGTVAVGIDVTVAGVAVSLDTEVGLGTVVGVAGGAAHEANIATATIGIKDQHPRLSNIISPRHVFIEGFGWEFWNGSQPGWQR